MYIFCTASAKVAMGCLYLRVFTERTLTLKIVFSLILGCYVIVFGVFIGLRWTIAGYITVVVLGIFSNVVICLPYLWVIGIEILPCRTKAVFIGRVLATGLGYGYMRR